MKKLLFTLFSLSILQPSVAKAMEQEICNPIEQKRPLSKKESWKLLYDAIQTNDLNEVKKVIDMGADVNTTGPDGNASHPLSVAIDKKNPELCNLLLNHGALPELKMESGARWSPLCNAMFHGSEIATLLIDSVKSRYAPEDRAQFFAEPLWIALRNQHASSKSEELCQLLIEAGADIESQDYDGNTLLMKFAEHNYPRNCKILLNAGANINAIDRYGHNALIHANSAETRRILVEHGTNGRLGNSLLWAASQVRMLIEAAPLARPRPENHPEAHLGNRMHSIVETIFKDQESLNATIRTTLLCLNRMKKLNPLSSELYRQFKVLFLPYLGQYVPLRRMINARDEEGRTAYDLLNVPGVYPDYEFLKPDNPGLLSNCMVQ